MMQLKFQKKIILYSLLLIALGVFSVWQYLLHRSLSEKPVACGSDFTWGVKCPFGSYCGSPYGKDFGPRYGGNCRALFWVPSDLVKDYKRNKAQEKHAQETSFQSFQIEINMMIGGGIAGATNARLINFKGQVYRISSPRVGIPTTRTLIKKVDPKLVQSLREALISAKIFEMEEGVPQYGGKNMRIVIKGKEKTIYFTRIPKNLSEAEKILEEILGEKISEGTESEQGNQESQTKPSTESPRFTWVLIFQNSGFPPNDNFIEGFWAYDMLTKYYRYSKNRIRFITTFNQYSEKWLGLGGIETFNAYNEQKIVSTKSDIFSQPTKQNYIDGLKWLEEKSTKLDDVMILSFTHGASSQKGANFDTDEEFDKDDELFVLGDRNTGKTENFYDGEFADLVARIRAKNMFIWISACHGGGFAWDIIDRIQKSGNVENLYLITQAIDERDVVYVKVPSINSPIVKFDWPDFKENFFGFLMSGLTGLREGYDENGDLILRVNPPEDHTIDFALQEIKDCKIDTLNLSATIGILEFAESSKFPMRPAFGCKWSETSKTREYPDGEANLGYINREIMDFVFKTSPR